MRNAVPQEAVVASMDFEMQLAEIRERLRSVREEQGIYQALRPWVDHIEQRSGYRTSPSTAMRQENGTSGLSVEYLLAVAISENLSPTWLLTGQGPKYGITLPMDAVELLAETVEKIRRGEIHAGARERRRA